MGETPRGRAAPPVACRLTADELAACRSELLPGLAGEASDVEAHARGYRWRFDPDRTPLSRIAAVVERERSCCAFLRFRLEVEPAGGPITLDVTGPEGTREVLDGLLARDSQGREE